MDAQLAIARFRRDLTLGTLLKAMLALGVLACLLFRGVIGNHLLDAVVLFGIGAIWLTLSYRSIRGSRLAAGSPSLIAAGDFSAAEDHIEQALRSFSLFRTSKLLSLHHLAVLRHAQRRWADAAELSRAVLAQRLGSLAALGRQSRLILADSLLELGDLRGTDGAILSLYQQRLTLAEALSLLTVQLDYESRIHAWDRMAGGLAVKVQLAELMGAAESAKTQALLALAAKKIGRNDWSDWLKRRAELLSETRDLIAARPALGELWPPPPPPDPTD
jgi:hypothetical protein